MSKNKSNIDLLHFLFLDWNIFISICSVALLFYFQLVTNHIFSIYYYIFVFTSTFVAYNGLRNENAIFSIKNTKNQQLIFILLSAVLLFCALKCFTWSQIGAYFLLGFLTFIYKYPLFLTKGLRTYNYLKIFIIAFVWLAGIFLIPSLSFLNFDMQIHYFPFYVAHFLFFIAITLPFDDADQQKDNFKTIPKKLGLKQTKIASLLLLLGYFILLYFFFSSEWLHIAHAIITIITAITILFYFPNKNSNYLFYYLDGTIIWQCFIVYIFHHFL